GGLGARGRGGRRHAAHVPGGEADYERVFARFTASTRNHVRKSARRGVAVRATTRPEDVRAYYDVHTRLAEQRGNYAFVYPVEVFLELVRLGDEVRFLVAEVEGRVAAGGLCFRAGPSVRSGHGATDRAYSSHYPFNALLTDAIRWGCEAGATTFDFGASGGIGSLEQFKAGWGAEAQANWEFTWHSPLWTYVHGL